MTEEVDVVVVGGGPGGSTTAALLARRGYSVLLLERTKFPRYHIGESLVPGCVPVLDELGITEQLDDFGFVRKYGITLVWGKEDEPWSVGFGEGGPVDHAWQVTRADFDQLLFNHARSLGATVLEEARVTDFVFAGERCTGVKYRFARSEQTHEVKARFVVDATGQSHMLARAHDNIAWEDGLRNLAVWSYFQGGTHYEGRDAGNILTENIDDGWLWVIPLHNGTRSVGWVSPAENVKSREGEVGPLLLERIASSREAKRLLAGARQVAGFSTAKDWSYKTESFHGPGYMLVGDAAGFVDPLFSTGVYLAMNSASLAAKSIDGILSEPDRAHELGDEYERGYREFLDVVLSFVRFFYDPKRCKEDYWTKAQQLVDPREELLAREDFVYLISGLAGLDGVLGSDRGAWRRKERRRKRALAAA